MVGDNPPEKDGSLVDLVNNSWKTPVITILSIVSPISSRLGCNAPRIWLHKMKDSLSYSTMGIRGIIASYAAIGGGLTVYLALKTYEILLRQ